MERSNHAETTSSRPIMTFTPPDRVQPDGPYLQKHVAKTTLPGGRHPNDIRSLAVDSEDNVYMATARGLFVAAQSFQTDEPLENLPPEWVPPFQCERLGEDELDYDIKEVRVDEEDRLWVVTRSEIVIYEGGRWHRLWDQTEDRNISAVMSVRPLVPLKCDNWAATPLVAVDSARGAGWVQKGEWTPLTLPEGVGRPLGVDEAPGGVWIRGTEGAVWMLADGTYKATASIGAEVRRVVAQNDVAWMGTGDGVYIMGPGGLVSRLTEFKIPVKDIRDLYLSPEGEVWAATSRGVWRKTHGERSMHYYHGKRYIPHPFCRALAQTSEKSMWVATAEGLSHLAEVPQTLEQKAARFEYRVRHRHSRLDGYVTSASLRVPGDLSTSEPRPSDNDGLWTAIYLAAEAYRYATTKEEEAQALAKKAYRAIERLEAVTTIPGFPTKAIILPDDPIQHRTSVPWLPSADGKWLWKADCSSDEIVGHMYGYSLYYDLVADDEEKARVAALVDRIMGHILDNDYKLIGPDGKQTQWGFWGPELLNGPWKSQQGLNSLEILSHLRAAYHMTGNDRYMESYHNLIDEHHYAENVLEQKIVTPGHVNHSDDELAFLSYYPLLKYEDDPTLREMYVSSLEHNWLVERIERNPLWNLMYGVLTGNHCDVAESVRTLREIPMDLLEWECDNTARDDVAYSTITGRFGELKTVEVLPYDELPIRKWNANPFRAIDGGDGRGEDDGAYYLLPYWMARYYGLIEA